MIYLLLAFSIFRTDSIITYGISNKLNSPISDALFKAFTTSGNRESILLYSTVFTFFGDSSDISNQKEGILGGALTSGFCVLLKYITNRKRPEGSSSRWNSSFPSGHAEMSSFIAFYFGEKYPKYRIPLYLWALLVGTSRVYLKRHWVSDVLAGYALGGLGAYLTIKFYENR